MSKTVLGIDVAKSKLDVALMLNGKALMKKFDNNIKGFRLMQGWLASLKIEQVHACLEATGPYGDAVAEFLYERGHRVSVVNPLQIKSFAKSDLLRNKTDQADARTIAAFCLAKDPRDCPSIASGDQAITGLDASHRSFRKNAPRRDEPFRDGPGCNPFEHRPDDREPKRGNRQRKASYQRSY